MKEDDLFLWKFGQMSRSRAYSAASKGKGGISMSAGEIAIRAGNTVAWYDYTNTVSITLSGSNVSRWNDALSSGLDLIQASGTAQPLLTANGVLFDGSNDFMLTGSVTYSQPIMVYLVMRQITYNKQYAGFFSTNHTGGEIELSQGTSAPRIQAISGGAGFASDENTQLTLNAFAIVRVLFNSGSGKLIVNSGTPVTGGTWSSTAAMQTIQLGRSQFGSGYYTNAEFKEILFRDKVDSATDEAAIYSYLKTKHSL